MREDREIQPSGVCTRQHSNAPVPQLVVFSSHERRGVPQGGRREPFPPRCFIDMVQVAATPDYQSRHRHDLHSGVQGALLVRPLRRRAPRSTDCHGLPVIPLTRRSGSTTTHASWCRRPSCSEIIAPAVLRSGNSGRWPLAAAIK